MLLHFLSFQSECLVTEKDCDKSFIFKENKKSLLLLNGRVKIHNVQPVLSAVMTRRVLNIYKFISQQPHLFLKLGEETVTNFKLSRHFISYVEPIFV
jgi:hypothetical protein